MKHDVTLTVPFPHEEVMEDADSYTRLVEDRTQVTQFGFFDRIEYPEEGGRLFWEKGEPFPKKGHIFPQAVERNDYVKRIIASQLRFFAKHPIIALLTLRRKALTDWLQNIWEISRVAYRPVNLKDEYFTRSCWEVGRLVGGFLLAYGIPEKIAMRFGRIVTLMFEYDDAYRYYMQDLATMTNKEALMNNAPKEVRLLAEEFNRRLLEKNPKLRLHINSVAKVVRIAWLFPRVRRALRRALMLTDFGKIQRDQADLYHVLLYTNYDFGGMNYEYRKRMHFMFNQK